MRKIYFLFLLAIGAATFTNAQTANNYFFKYDAAVALEDMSAGSTQVFDAMVDGQQSPAISFFPFSFANNSYSSFSINDDGILVLGNAVYSPYPYDNYFQQTIGLDPIANPTYPILMPWGEDLYTANNGGVSYKIVGAAPARKLVVDFKMRSAEDNIGTANKTFQVWLFEGSNNIQFVYGNCPADWFTSANIGLASSLTEYLSVTSATNTTSTTEVAHNNGTPINAGTSYTFSPSPLVVVAPITTSVSISPAYPVAGQKLHTIYLGYGEQAVTLSTSVAGGNPAAAGYSYSWSPATGLSSATAAMPVASPQVSTVYTVTITDGNGNSTTQSVTIHVIDPREGAKFNVCKNGVKTLCISKEAVAAQLNNGATLGSCAPSTGYNGQGDNLALSAADAMLKATAFATYPNPSTGAFVVRTPANGQVYTITISDVAGRTIARTSVKENQQTVSFDLGKKAPGVYLVRMVGNGTVQTAKMIIK